MFCQFCGNELPDAGDFCPKCGKGRQQGSTEPKLPSFEVCFLTETFSPSAVVARLTSAGGQIIASVPCAPLLGGFSEWQKLTARLAADGWEVLTSDQSGRVVSMRRLAIERPRSEPEPAPEYEMCHIVAGRGLLMSSAFAYMGEKPLLLRLERSVLPFATVAIPPFNSEGEARTKLVAKLVTDGWEPCASDERGFVTTLRRQKWT